jgi:hypothetical protein
LQDVYPTEATGRISSRLGHATSLARTNSQSN